YPTPPASFSRSTATAAGGHASRSGSDLPPPTRPIRTKVRSDWEPTREVPKYRGRKYRTHDRESLLTEIPKLVENFYQIVWNSDRNAQDLFPNHPNKLLENEHTVAFVLLHPEAHFDYRLAISLREDRRNRRITATKSYGNFPTGTGY